MSIAVREGKFDVAVVAGPALEVWPSVGVRTLSALCAEMGLTVGVFGGPDLRVQGVFALPGTGGLILAEDAQRRVHRIHARAIVRISRHSTLPDPFPGWRSEGLIPLSTANRLFKDAQIAWEPLTVILGTGNPALRFGASLLDAGVSEVIAIESHSHWGGKRVAAWEVERRRFEMAGGKIIEAQPVGLRKKSASIYEIKVKDNVGVRILDASRIVSAGPFREMPAVREYPRGSLLFDLEQTASPARADNVEGWALEEERGRVLAGRIARILVEGAEGKGEHLQRSIRRARARLKRYRRHRDEPFVLHYRGKWLVEPDSKAIKSFVGAPQHAHRFRPVASIECFEDIPCNLCQKACPESAIDIIRSRPRPPGGPALRAQTGKPDARERFLVEADCTACGLCLSACPSGVPVLLHESDSHSYSKLTLPWRGVKPWKAGESATVVNRRGESLGSARVVGVVDTGEAKRSNIPPLHPEPVKHVQLVELEVPAHLAWAARYLKRPALEAAEDAGFLGALEEEKSKVHRQKVHVTLDGDKRLVREGIPLSIALFEIGRARPEDVLLCPDGSCGLCSVSVDGVKKLACQTNVHQGMVILTNPKAAKKAAVEPAAGPSTPPSASGEQASEAPVLCPCQGISVRDVEERLEQGKISSPDTAVTVTHVGEGRCHGQLCTNSFRRLLSQHGLDSLKWIDWRFPWTDWVPGGGGSGKSGAR